MTTTKRGAATKHAGRPIRYGEDDDRSFTVGDHATVPDGYNDPLTRRPPWRPGS
jgi:hypothetical protein